MMRLKSKESGLTLVEILVAVLLGILITAGILKIYVSSRQNYQMTSALTHIHDSGRYVFDLLAKEIRMSGYQGCADPQLIEANMVASNPPVVNMYEGAIRGNESSLPNDVPLSHKKYIRTKLDSDVLTVVYAAEPSISIDKNMAGRADVISMSGNALDIQQDDIVMVSDCNSVDIFKVTNNPGKSTGSVSVEHAMTAGKNISASLSRAYTVPGASLRRFMSHHYFVARKRSSTQALPIYALFSREADGNIVEVIEGVENLQVRFGIENAGTVRYMEANDPAIDWARVSSVRLGLLVVSNELIAGLIDNKSYRVADTKYSRKKGKGNSIPNDFRLRRAYTTTISLRNRTS